MLKDFLYVFKLIKKNDYLYKVDIFKLGGNFLKFWENVLHEYNISLEYFQSCIQCIQFMLILLHYKCIQETSFVHIIPHKVF